MKVVLLCNLFSSVFSSSVYVTRVSVKWSIAKRNSLDSASHLSRHICILNAHYCISLKEKKKKKKKTPSFLIYHYLSQGSLDHILPYCCTHVDEFFMLIFKYGNVQKYSWATQNKTKTTKQTTLIPKTLFNPLSAMCVAYFWVSSEDFQLQTQNSKIINTRALLAFQYSFRLVLLLVKPTVIRLWKCWTKHVTLIFSSTLCNWLVR